MGGRTGSAQTSTQTTTPPPDQQQNIDMLLSGARDFYNTGGPKYYAGQTYADTNPLTIQGRQGSAGYAGGVGGALAGDTVANDRFWLNPNNVFNPGAIPGYNQAKQGIIADANANLQRNVLPQIRSGSVADGVYGGSRQGIAEGLAIGENNRNIGQTLAQMDMNAYSQGLAQNNAAASRAPQTYGLGLAPSNTLQSTGEQYRSDQQRAIDANMARWNFEQLAPLLNLQNFQGLTGTAGQYGGTTSGATTGGNTGGNSALPWLGAGLSLLSLLGGS